MPMRRGCIKASKGPWIVHRITKDGGLVTNYRFLSEIERQNNKERAQSMCQNTNKFMGLRAQGNYRLPKHAGNNDLPKALCDEAGWHVDEDGTVFRKASSSMDRSMELAEFPSQNQIECY